MTSATVDSLDLRVIEGVLQMGGGYVLDFSNRTFSTFFNDLGVNIDDARFSAEGTSKANRLRCFLKTTPVPLSGRTLAALLQHRLMAKPGVGPNELEHYRKLVVRLGGELAPSDTGKDTRAAESEGDLLARVFRPELFSKLPFDAAMSNALIDRMGEARRCVEVEAHLAAIILCGSVLEGMCVGFGTRHPERVNRAFAQQYNRPVPQFHEWKLREWIDVLGRLGDLSPNIEKFGHGVRDFRNYVHPAEQLAHRFSPDAHTARIGFQVVIAAAEDLLRGEESIARSAGPSSSHNS